MNLTIGASNKTPLPSREGLGEGRIRAFSPLTLPSPPRGRGVLIGALSGMSPFSPAVLLTLTVAVHVLGRSAAICHPYRADSFVYATAAYKLWHAGATFDDLIPDKPPGQALLTGWCYHLAPEPHTRLTLVPIESAFLLGACALLWLLARRFYGSTVAAATTLFFVMVHNIYNALDFTTDGFTLNECYLAMPMMLAVLAHLTVCGPLRRGLVRGLGLGAALAIKQSAVGLLAALVIHGAIELLRRRASVRTAIVASVSTLFGMALVAVPGIAFLWWHGWLAAHLHDLAEYTGNHLAQRRWALLRWANLAPLLPAAWCCLLGLVGWMGLRRERVPSNAAAMHPSANRDDQYGSLVIFLVVWLAAELAILSTMNKPSSHYFQQMVMPAVLLGGCGMAAFLRGTEGLPTTDRSSARSWAAATAVILAALVLMPLGAAASRRVRTFDYRREVSEFAWYLANWSPRWNIPDEHGVSHDADP